MLLLSSIESKLQLHVTLSLNKLLRPATTSLTHPGGGIAVHLHLSA